MSLLTGKNYIVIPKATTVERLALTAVNGMLVYDTTLNAFYKYENGAWSSFGGGSVSSVFGRTGAVVAQSGDYTKSDVGLGNVDNTSDANKPVSSATQTALNGKLDIQFKRSLQTFTGVTAERALDIIPLEVNTSDYLYRLFLWARMDAATGTIRVRIGTYAAPIDGGVGANSIGQQSLLGTYTISNNNRVPFVRNINIVGGASGSAISFLASNATTLNDETTAATPTVVSIDSTTQQYLYISMVLSAVGRTYTSDSLVVQKTKLT